MKIDQLLWWKKKEDYLDRLVEAQRNTNDNIQSELSFELCMDDIEPIMKGPEAGKMVIINGYMYAQAILIGIRDKYTQTKGFGKQYKISTIGKIIRTARVSGASILLGHNEITIAPEKENVMLNNAHKKTQLVDAQIRNNIVTPENSLYNRFAKKEVVAHTAVTFDDEDHYSWFALPCVVLSPDIEKVKHVMSEIKKHLNIGSIRWFLPKYGQKAAIQAAIPFCSQIDARYLKKINKRTIAAMLPLRNDFAEYPLEGPIICTDEETGRPIKICPTKLNPENTFILSPPGSGKTTMILNLASHAIGNGDDVWIIEPKNEDSDGTDYINFVNEYNGTIARWGPDGINPSIFIIFYDKERMGTDIRSYRKAKDDWFDVVENYYRARLGGLNERQAGLLIKSLIDNYIRIGVIDKDGNPINTEKWDVPGALAWPSENDLRVFWKKEYDNPNSIYYKDPSIDALIMNTMKSEPGGPLWWAANSHEHFKIYDEENGKKKTGLRIFDISQLPDNMKNAVAIQIMGMCNTLYFPKPNDGQPRKRTYLIFDEVGKLSKVPVLIPYMERCLREGRAPGVTGVFCTQDPKLDKDFLDMIKANCKNLFILNNLDPMNIDLFLDAFKIPEQYMTGLMQKTTGKGYYFRNRKGLKIRVELDEMPKNAMLNSKRGMQNSNATCATAHGFEVEDCYRKIYEERGFFLPAWLKGEPQKSYPGFKNYTPFDPIGHGGSMSCWIRKDLIEEKDGLTKLGKPKQDLIGPEGEIHYCCVCRIAGWMMRQGFPNVEMHLRGKADITWGEVDENGNLVDPENSGCLEYEGETTHKDISDWNGKLERARALGYKHIIFTGKSTVCAEMKGKKGSLVGEFVFPQGEANLLKELERIRDEIAECKMRNLSINRAFTQETEALQTSA